MELGFGALVQGLPTAGEQVLAISRIVEARSDHARFNPRDVAYLFDALRLPAPGNISETLRRLAARGLVVSRRAGGWSVTPQGRAKADELVGSVSMEVVRAEEVEGGDAVLAGVHHPLIPPTMAPRRFRQAVDAVLEVAPFERNVFLMTRFPPRDAPSDDKLVLAMAAAKEQVISSGLCLHVADDRQADDELFPNVAAHIWASKYGVAFLETLDADDPANGQLNDNVLIEIGAMLVSGRRCCLLKDTRAPSPPSDFVAQIYKEVDFGETDQVQTGVKDWLTKDLAL